METRRYIPGLRIFLSAVFLLLWVTTALSQNEENQTDREEQTSEQEQTRTTGTTLHISPAELMEIQQALVDLGYEPGNTDGTWGEETLSAIRNFQRENGLEPTGQLDYRTLTRLSRFSEPGARAATGGAARAEADQQQFGAGTPAESQSRQVIDESPQQPAPVQQEPESEVGQAPQPQGGPEEPQAKGMQAQQPQGGREQPQPEGMQAQQQPQEDREQEESELSRQEDSFATQEELPFSPYQPGYVYQPGFIYERGFPQQPTSQGEEAQPQQEYFGISPEWQNSQNRTGDGNHPQGPLRREEE